jgi:hypothetical protein
VLYTRSEILVTMTVARLLRLDDADSRFHFVRARTTGAVCHALTKCDRLVGWYRVQSVRERL